MFRRNETQKQIRIKTIVSIKSKIREIVHMLKYRWTPPIPELMTPRYYDSGNLALTYGFDPMVIRENHKRLVAAGWTCRQTPAEFVAGVRKDMAHGSTMTYHLEDYRKSLTLWYFVGGEGSNCERVEIGTETIEQPIYEIVCNDGIDEMKKAAAS